MQVESSDLLRNVAVVGHNDTGKTSLLSGLLYTSGVSSRLNRVEDGNTVTDFDAEEISRGMSIGLAPCFVPWRKHKINFLDCPGLGGFLTDSRIALRATDAALLCVHAVAGVQVSTERVWQFASELGLPVAIHLTKMDRENADFERALGTLRETFGRTVTPIQVPLGSEGGFRGVADLIGRRVLEFERDGKGEARTVEAPELAEKIAAWRSQLDEAVAETDDKLMETFFEQGKLSDDQLLAGLKRAIRKRAIFPVTCSAGGHSIGNSALLDSIVDLLPSPLERSPYAGTDQSGERLELGASDEQFAALVFKTLHDPYSGKITIFRVISGTLDADTTYHNSNRDIEERLGHILLLQGKQGANTPRLVAGDIGGVAKLKHTLTGETLCAKGRSVVLDWFKIPEPAMSFAIEPKAKGDEERIGDAAHKLVEEDPTLRAGRDAQTGEYLFSGTGQLHVEIAVARLKARYKVEVILHPPKVPYLETIRKPADGHGRHKKQTGGRGQFADCKIRVEPQPRGGGFEFADEIFGGAIPHNFRPAVEKGIVEAAERGFLAGFPMVDFRVRLKDGQYHDVDSSEIAFKIAGSLAFKDAMASAGATLLEPVMHVEITTTEEFLGDIMGDLSHRRGKPQGVEASGQYQLVKAVVPMSEMLNFAPALRSMTQGRSTFSMEFSHYEEVPRNLQEKIVAEARAATTTEA
ncbi:MAG TPA: elongation factor G [Thermoanaerobaculia bacterium]|nr:elongation factor G [Thermoanaerobaculia bacterium]